MNYKHVYGKTKVNSNNSINLNIEEIILPYLSLIISQFTGTLRLLEGSNKNEGRLEVYIQNAWGTVCVNNFDTTDATIACQQLGYWYVLVWKHYAIHKYLGSITNTMYVSFI